MNPRSLLLLAALAALAGCATPKEINGQKVIATRWINGRIVYILAPDLAAEKAGVDAMHQATAGTVIAPLK